MGHKSSVVSADQRLFCLCALCTEQKRHSFLNRKNLHLTVQDKKGRNMGKNKYLIVYTLLIMIAASNAFAAPALSVLGKDYVFPNKLEGLPAKLSDFDDLEINTFTTSDSVKLSYWEAGQGRPLIFIPG